MCPPFLADFEELLTRDSNLAKTIYKNIALVTAARLKVASNKLIELKSSEDIASEILD